MIPQQAVKVGETRVAYEDTVNPRREGLVVEIALAFGGQFVIGWDDGGFDVSDLRQAGWSLVETGPTNEDLKRVETDSEEFADRVETEWAKLMGGELLIYKDENGVAGSPEIRDLVERMGFSAIENILMVGDGVDQQDAQGQPLPGNVVTEQEVARRVTTALAVLFYGN